MARKINNYPAETPAAPHRLALTCRTSLERVRRIELALSAWGSAKVTAARGADLASLAVSSDRS
jgi:hypothetical protein